jgi:hypothetical protein
MAYYVKVWIWKVKLWSEKVMIRHLEALVLIRYEIRCDVCYSFGLIKVSEGEGII